MHYSCLLNVLSAMLSALLFSHFCPKQAKMKPNKHKALHSAEREFGGTLGEPLFVYIYQYVCVCVIIIDLLCDYIWLQCNI